MSWEGNGAPELVLASASPRRLEILRSLGLEPVAVVAASVDERPRAGEGATELVERLARAKAGAVASSPREPARSRGDDWVVVGADTVIDLDGEVLGKPLDAADAGRMLRALSGRSHRVVTGVAVVGRVGGRPVDASAVEATDVVMRAFGQVEVGWYLASGEWDGKAGAYAIQGLGALLVSGIDGSYHNVVGLPVTVLDRLLADVGVPLRELLAA